MQSTACAVLYDTVDIGRHVGLAERSLNGVVHLTLTWKFRN